MLRYLRPNPASSPPSRAARHQLCSGVEHSCTSTLIFTEYKKKIKKSTIWIVKASPHARLPGFFVLLFHTADLSKTLTSALTIWEKKWNRCCAVIEFAKEKKRTKHSTWVTVCLMFRVLISLSATCGTSASVANGMWISRPRYCQWVKKNPCTLPG